MNHSTHNHSTPRYFTITLLPPSVPLPLSLPLSLPPNHSPPNHSPLNHSPHNHSTLLLLLTWVL